MEQNTGLTVALILVAIAVLMQAGAMLGIWLAIRKVPGQIESVRSDVKAAASTRWRNRFWRSSTTRASPCGPLPRTWRRSAPSFATALRMPIEVAAELLDKSRAQIVRVDQMVTDLVEKVETTADAVQKGVLGPIQEVSAVVKGVRSGLEFLFSRRRVTNVSEATQDEQLFI